MRHILILAALIAGFGCLASGTHADGSAQLVILPIDINAGDELAYLSTEIPKVLRDQLTGAGATVIDLPADRLGRLRDLRADTGELRRTAFATGASHVVWGSFTQLGDAFSIDIRLLETAVDGPPRTVFVEGAGMENLLLKLGEAASEIELAVFQRDKVLRIDIEGSRRIEVDAIRRRIKTAPGDVYIPRNLSRDIRAIYQMGYFEDIRVESERSADGRIVTFRVTEKPTIRVIRIKGARKGYKSKEIKENLDIKTGSVLNVFTVRNNVQRIENLYKEKNYHNVQVDYRVIPKGNNQADIEFTIDEGSKVKIKTISFDGNDAFSDKQLKKLMRTSEKGLFSFVTGSGELNREDLEQDAAILTAFYQNNGYIEARVSDPEIVFEDKWIFVNFQIDEGMRYKTGQVDIDGDLIRPKESLLARLMIPEQEFYSREVVRNDVLGMKDIYADEGYAYVDVAPKIDRNPEALTVDITYTIRKGKPVYFEKILIGGNTKTRDKVIRRELKVYERELYSGRRLKRSINSLYRLDYFEDVKVNTSEGSADDLMVLNIDLTEKSTGAFTFGGGYSTTESVFVSASISQRNLFGRGQILSLQGEVGGRTTRYNLSFTEPWLFDIPLSAGFDLYSWVFEYDQYNKDSTGGLVRFSYPIWDFTRGYMSYRYDSTNVTDIAENAAKSIQELAGTNVTSSVMAEVRYDSRNRRFNPTSGSSHLASIEYAGGPLGGDIAFTKLLAETSWVFPIWLNHIFFVHGEGGYVTENAGGILPDYERFYLGGMNSLRGFDWQDISATDEDGNEIGGDKYVQANIEYRVPLLEESGVIGLVFLDMGNVYGTDEAVDLGNLRESAGVGVRWFSPIGPIRLEYGFILDPTPEEDSSGKFEFSMGTAF